MTRSVSSRGRRRANRLYRAASIADEQRDFTPAIGQLIIDGLLTRWRRRRDDETTGPVRRALHARINLCFSFDSHYRIRRGQYRIPPGPYQADYRFGCDAYVHPMARRLIIDRSLSPGVSGNYQTSPMAPWDRDDGDVANVISSLIGGDNS